MFLHDVGLCELLSVRVTLDCFTFVTRDARCVRGGKRRSLDFGDRCRFGRRRRSYRGRGRLCGGIGEGLRTQRVDIASLGGLRFGMFEKPLEFTADRFKDDFGYVRGNRDGGGLIDPYFTPDVFRQIPHRLKPKEREHDFIFQKRPLVEVQFVCVGELAQVLLNICGRNRILNDLGKLMKAFLHRILELGIFGLHTYEVLGPVSADFAPPSSSRLRRTRSCSFMRLSLLLALSLLPICAAVYASP